MVAKTAKGNVAATQRIRRCTMPRSRAKNSSTASGAIKSGCQILRAQNTAHGLTAYKAAVTIAAGRPKPRQASQTAPKTAATFEHDQRDEQKARERGGCSVSNGLPEPRLEGRHAHGW